MYSPRAMFNPGTTTDGWSKELNLIHGHCAVPHDTVLEVHELLYGMYHRTAHRIVTIPVVDSGYMLDTSTLHLLVTQDHVLCETKHNLDRLVDPSAR
jgi:hypothetical protein